MNAQALLERSQVQPSAPSLRQRAADVIRAWNAWRLARLSVDHAIDAGVLGCLLASWILAYIGLCPATPSHRPQHVAALVSVQR